MLGEKPTIIVSNVATSPIPYVIAGSASKSCGAFIPSMGIVAGGFVIISHCDVVTISFNSDISRCKDPKEIISILENVLDGILKD